MVVISLHFCFFKDIVIADWQCATHSRVGFCLRDDKKVRSLCVNCCVNMSNLPGCTNLFTLSAKINRVLTRNDITEAVFAKQRRHRVNMIKKDGKLPFLYDLSLGRPIQAL